MITYANIWNDLNDKLYQLLFFWPFMLDSMSWYSCVVGCKQFFRRFHSAYLDAVSNPFHVPGKKITSKTFAERVSTIVKSVSFHTTGWKASSLQNLNVFCFKIILYLSCVVRIVSSLASVVLMLVNVAWLLSIEFSLKFNICIRSLYEMLYAFLFCIEASFQLLTEMCSVLFHYAKNDI